MKNKNLIGKTYLMATRLPDGTCKFREMGKIEVLYRDFVYSIKNLRWLLIPKDVIDVIKDLKERVTKLENKK